MSSVGIEQYFPFDTGAGSGATLPRWRSMGRLFIGSGVVPNFLSQFSTTNVSGLMTIQPGAVWIDGFYGESDAVKTMSNSGLGPGMLVARMDPNARTITLNYVPGQNTPHQDYNGYYEVPLYQITGPSTLNDIRQFCNPIPERVAKGRTYRNNPYTTSTNLYNYGFDTTDGSPNWANSYQFRCPYGADYLCVSQVGFHASVIGAWYNMRLVRTNAATNTTDLIAWNGTTNASVVGAYMVTWISQVVPCKPGDLLTIQHNCSTNGAQGLVGYPFAYFQVRALS